jgi:hypothetical protein
MPMSPALGALQQIPEVGCCALQYSEGSGVGVMHGARAHSSRISSADSGQVHTRLQSVATAANPPCKFCQRRPLPNIRGQQ